MLVKIKYDFFPIINNDSFCHSVGIKTTDIYPGPAGLEIGSLTTKGDKKRGIAGDLDIDVTLDGAVNSVKVAGTLFGVWTCDAIKSISTTEWLGGSINAPSVGSITTKGDKKRGIAGDLDINVMLNSSINSAKVAGTLSGDWTCDAIKSISAMDVVEANLTLSQKPDAKILALGKLTVKGWIDSSRILSAGNIGSISAGAIANSSCFAGVTDTNDLNADGVLDLPDPAVDVNYVEPATIKSITVKGIKGEQYCVINSNIAAAQILSASLAYPENNNNGIPFGLSAGFIKALNIKDAEGTESWKNLDKPSDSKEFGDAKVLLY